MLVSGSTPLLGGGGGVCSGGLVVLGGNPCWGGVGGGGGGGSTTPFAAGGCGASSNVVVGGGGAPCWGIGVEPVQATIWHCLNNYAYADACFLAERIHAEAPSDETLHILSTCYYRSGSKTKAYVLLSSCSLKTPHHMSSKNRYLLSLVCFELEKYAEAESTLLKHTKVESNRGATKNLGGSGGLFEQLERAYGDIGAFALKLYGLVCVNTERSGEALEAFTRCLKLNPFLWNCYEYCCGLGGGCSDGGSKTVKETDKSAVHRKALQRVFQLPDTLASGPTQTQTPQQSPASYLPLLIGSTAASLILSQSRSPKCDYRDRDAHHHGGMLPPNQPNNNHHNNQNYFHQSNTSLNSSTSSNVFLNSAGVLHPSNRNNIKPSKRNLFTSTPMGVGGAGHAGAGASFGIIPLLMDSSGASTVSNTTGGAQPDRVNPHGINSSLLASSTLSPSHYSSPVVVTGTTPGIANTSGYSPVVGDFTDELDSRHTGPQLATEPRPKKQGTTGVVNSSTPATTNPPHGTVTISTSSNHTVRRSSRLFTHHHHHSHSGFLKENNKQNNVLVLNPVGMMMSTPPSSTSNVITPESGAGSGRRNKKSGGGASSSSSSSSGGVLKPKLRLNKTNVGGSCSTASTVTGAELINESIKNVESACHSLESSGEFFRCVLDKSEVSEGTGKEAEPHWDEVATKHVDAFRNGVDPLLHILSNMSAPYTSQTNYSCAQAISQYQRLKPSQYETGWVIGNIARCYFELGNYEECVKHYKRMMEMEPWRTEGLEWLSTAFWHLQKETELSSLAQDLMASNRTNEVATWVAAGNCFSLHKEHETAIKFFKRAIQVNPACAYAYTLLGHEYVLTEELEKAMKCFRAATRIERNHYNAWYGMGMIFYKQERYERAEVYYRKAIGIHPNNSVLLCHLGVVQHALGHADKSLTTFTRALEANRNDPLCKFHKASVLFSIGKLELALNELEELKVIVPKESLVYFLMAKIYSKQGDTHKALLHFTWATDLDPKGANNQIKESIEPLLSRVTTTTGANPGQDLLTTADSTALEQVRDEDDDDDDDEDDDDEEEDREEDEDDEARESEEPSNASESGLSANRVSTRSAAAAAAAAAASNNTRSSH